LALLRIERGSGYTDCLRAYRVIIDGKTAGKIGDGEIMEFPITCGQHQLALKMDWCGSKTIRFTVADNEDVFTFDAKSNVPNPMAVYWYALFAWNSYLLIEPRMKLSE
jgi:hypothetical protein